MTLSTPWDCYRKVGYHIIGLTTSFLLYHLVTSFLLSPHFTTSSYLTMSSLCHIPDALTSSYVAISSLTLFFNPINILPYNLILNAILILPHHHTLSFHPIFFFHIIILSFAPLWCLREHHNIIDIMLIEVTTSSPLRF